MLVPPNPSSLSLNERLRMTTSFSASRLNEEVFYVRCPTMSAARPPATSPIWRVLGLLPDAKPRGDNWQARCPAHEDHQPSLSIREGDDGRVLLKCFAGCPVEAIVAALGLTLADLFEPNVSRYRLRLNGHEYRHVRQNLPSGEKKIRWEVDGKTGLNGTGVEELPLYGLACLADAPAGSTVYLCEGEKAAQALIDAGLYAVGTVTGASATPVATVLEPLRDYQVVLWPDNDQPGREHMERIATMLNMVRPPNWLDWPDAPPKGDAADYLAAGLSPAALPALTRPWRPVQAPLVEQKSPVRIVNAVDLLRAEFDPPRWAVPELLMEGLALLAGRPKLGKSWLGLNLAVDVAEGALALDRIKTTRGEVLYMALEDGERRMQERLQLVLGNREPSPLLSFAYDWPVFDSTGGGLELLEDWIAAHPLARLVVIDTFKRVRPAEKGNSKRLYDLDYDALAPLAALARAHGIAIVVVFHARKGEADDPLDLVSGTTGLSGACDAVLVLRRERGQADASLFVTGRDIEERDMALRWHGKDADRFHWEWIGEAEDFRISAERRQIVDVVSEMPGSKPSDIAGALNKTVGSVRYLLFKMVREGQIRIRGGAYYSMVGLGYGDNDPSISPATTATPGTTPSPPIPTPNARQASVSASSVSSASSPYRGNRGGEGIKVDAITANTAMIPDTNGRSHGAGIEAMPEVPGCVSPGSVYPDKPVQRAGQPVSGLPGGDEPGAGQTVPQVRPGAPGGDVLREGNPGRTGQPVQAVPSANAAPLASSASGGDPPTGADLPGTKDNPLRSGETPAPRGTDNQPAPVRRCAVCSTELRRLEGQRCTPCQREWTNPTPRVDALEL